MITNSIKEMKSKNKSKQKKTRVIDLKHGKNINEFVFIIKIFFVYFTKLVYHALDLYVMFNSVIRSIILVNADTTVLFILFFQSKLVTINLFVAKYKNGKKDYQI